MLRRRLGAGLELPPAFVKNDCAYYATWKSASGKVRREHLFCVVGDRTVGDWQMVRAPHSRD